MSDACVIVEHMFDQSALDRAFSPESWAEASRVRNSLRVSSGNGQVETPTKMAPRQEPAKHEPTDSSPEVRFEGHLQALGTMAPGAALAALVSGLDRTRLEGHDLTTLLSAESRLISHFQAGLYRTIGELGCRPELADPETAASEVAAALRLTRQASEIEHDLALQLIRHPEVMEALESGAIDLRRVRVIIANVHALEPGTARLVLARVLPEATHLTTGQLGARLRRLAMTADTEGAETRYRAALEERRIVIYDNSGGTASLHAVNLPPDRLNGIRDRLEELTRASTNAEDTRTADQLRADVFLDLLENQATGGRGSAFVNIDVQLTTLMGVDDEPGHIPGWGPVTAEMARDVVERQTDCTWEYTVLDQGRPVATGTLRRRPAEGMRRRIRSRTPSCIHPGCRVPARRADIDHTTEWARSGTTTLDNLAPLCEHHHQLKDRGWHYRRRDDGSFEFTSPTGHTYVSYGRSP